MYFVAVFELSIATTPIVYLIAFIITGLASDFGATSLAFSHRVDDSCFDDKLTDCPYFRFWTANLENGNLDNRSDFFCKLTRKTGAYWPQDEGPPSVSICLLSLLPGY